MQISKRAQGLSESATMKVTRRAAELKAAGLEILSFGAGEPDFDSPAVAIEAARQALADGFTRYTPASGVMELRSALAEHYQGLHGAPWQGENALITVGAKSALFQCFQILIDEGDEVILPYPAWVSFEEQIRFAGGHPVTVPMSPVDGFTIHADPLLEAMTERTRVVLLNSPSNPTGGTISEEDLMLLVEVCAERGVIVICDETYERFVYGGRAHASGAALASKFPGTIILISSFSKTYAMTGWRIGYMLGGAELIRKLGALQGHMTSNPTSFAMLGALAALRGAEANVQEMIVEFEKRRDLMVKGLRSLPGFECEPPNGAFYVFPNVQGCFGSGRQGSVELANHFLESARVAVVPGLAFGDDNHIRLSFACSRENIEIGLERMRTALES